MWTIARGKPRGKTPRKTLSGGGDHHTRGLERTQKSRNDRRVAKDALGMSMMVHVVEVICTFAAPCISISDINEVGLCPCRACTGHEAPTHMRHFHPFDTLEITYFFRPF